MTASGTLKAQRSSADSWCCTSLPSDTTDTSDTNDTNDTNLIEDTLPEYPPVVLGNELGGEETKQGNDRKRERYPIEPCIERYTEHRTHKGEDRAQNHLVERVREEQNDEQRADGAKEERFSPERHTPIGRQCFNQPACFGRMPEDIEAPRASTPSIKNRCYSRRRSLYRLTTFQPALLSS